MRRSPSSPHPIAILLIAIVAVPELLKRCKPFARTLGDVLQKAGKEIHRMGEVEEETPPRPVEPEPNPSPEPCPDPEPEAPKSRKKKTP